MINVITSGKNNKTREKIIDPAECGNCECVFGFEDDDVAYGEFGCGYVICPECGEKVYLDDYIEDVTADTVEYPRHFAKMGVDKAVRIPDAEIQSWIEKGMKWSEENHMQPGECYYVASGDTIVIMINCGDVMSVYVAKNYEETEIRIPEAPYAEDIHYVTARAAAHIPSV